jgi:pantoate kinase
MPWVAEAFCPGHITAFFEVVDHPLPQRAGSRGAGVCTTLGATAKATVEGPLPHELIVRINGEEAEAPVTRLAARKFFGNAKYRMEVDVTLDLPLSQGFGMSGAGVLASLIALNEATGRRKGLQKLGQAAHSAEVRSRTGMGDVYPQLLGGMDVRTMPGAPGWGLVKSHRQSQKLVLCVLGEPILTREVLEDEDVMATINRVGGPLVDQFAANPSWESLFRLGRRFSRDVGLMSGRIGEAIEAAEACGMASMSMLGNSVFAAGDAERLEEILSSFGETYVCRVANEGASLTRAAEE